MFSSRSFFNNAFSNDTLSIILFKITLLTSEMAESNRLLIQNIIKIKDQDGVDPYVFSGR
jgi:hypothetical protein